MQKASALLYLLLICLFTHAQIKPPLAIADLKEGLNPVEEIRLFDLQEIKERKIDTVYVIYHPASWAENHPTANPCTCSYNDTLSRYVFDNEGRITGHTYFQQRGDYSTTYHYDSLGYTFAMTNYRRIGAQAGSRTIMFDRKTDSLDFRQIFIRSKSRRDSVITAITFHKFSHGQDTATILTTRYNDKGRLIEVKSSVNKKNAREFDDDNGSSTYHFKYDYDDSGRLIYYRDYSRSEYQKISYPFYGRLTESFDVSTNQLKERTVKLVKEEDGVITVTFNTKQITLTPLQKGSKLFKLRTILEPGEFPLLFYHEIVYKVRQ